MSDELDPLVRAWLAGHVGDIAEVTLLTGGYVNENLLVVAEGGRFVLRRYLRGDGVRTRDIEAAIVTRVHGRVPVARVVAIGAPAGEPLLLSEFVSGELVSTALTGGVDPGGLGAAVGTALAAIGSVRFPTAGFFGWPDLVPVAGSVPGRLVDFVDERLVGYARTVQPVLDALPNESRLVHSDFNPKNLLAEHRADGWAVTAVLDWEFAFSGHPLVDVGNLLRFREDYPPAFVEGFETGYRGGGGALAAGWQAAAEALDMFALADLLTRGPDSPLFDKVVGVLKGRLG